MGSPEMKKVRIVGGEEDRISMLPDELIHRILSFVDAKEAVQTSALSQRWRFIWTTLPYLCFDWFDNSNNRKFVRHVLSNRNHQSHISELKLDISRNIPPRHLIKKFVEYAISHNIQCFHLNLLCGHKPYKLSTFSSKSLKKLELAVQLEVCASESDLWDLPALTTLHLKSYGFNSQKLSDSCLACLPALKTLSLHGWDLSISPSSFSLPNLTTLCLSGCKLPNINWDFPALLSLYLHRVTLPDNMSDIFSTLLNLQDLTLELSRSSMQRDHIISCPRLVNLEISTHCYIPHSIVVLAPKLSNFSCVGIFSITFGVPELKNVCIKLRNCFEILYKDRKKIYPQFASMLLGLGNAKILTFDSESIEVLSEFCNLLVSLPSPFYNLMYVKLPWGYEESSIPSALRSYLLGGSPRATIVTKLPQDDMIPQIATVSVTTVNAPQTATVLVTAENAALEEPLAAQTKGMVDCQYKDKTVIVETLDLKVQEQHVVDNSLVDADRVRPTDFPAEGTNNNWVSCFKGKRYLGLWRGYEVNSEFVLLLDRIMQKYPETFKNFTTKNKKLCTVRLNMLCTSLNDFTNISMAEVDPEIIVQYRDVFSYLQSLGFNLSWVLNRLDYIQHLQFSKPLTELHAMNCHIDDAKSKVQNLQDRLGDAVDKLQYLQTLHAINCRLDDGKSKVQNLQDRLGDAVDKLQNLQTLRAKKTKEIEKDFGTMATNLAVGFIGDDLLSGP